MYGKTSLGADQLSGKLTPRRKRALAGAGIAMVLGLGGLGAWAAMTPDAYTGSGAGCVNVTFPNSMGGANAHYCGSAARSFCKNAFGTTTQLTLLARPQCRLAGLAP
jgi:hypothetical protein